MGLPGRVIVVLGVLCGAALPAAAQEDESIVFAGLRPSSDADMKGTAIRRLAEAQGLRQVAENVVAAVSGRKVVGHDELRDLLGAGYLVELVDCAGEADCILRLMRPLRARGLKQVVVGDYFVDGAAYRFRITLYQLGSKARPKTLTFDLPQASVEEPKAWQKHLDSLFANRGKVELVTNVQGAICTVDARPCDLGAERILALPPGEHVLELSKPGYVTKSRVVLVESGQLIRVALGLDALPIQAGAAPSRLTEGQSEAGAGTANVFGRVEMAFVVDDHNIGEVYDETAVASDVLEPEWNLSLLPASSFLGVSFAGPKAPKKFQIRGLLLAGVFFAHRVRVPISQVDIIREDLGLKLTIGRMFHPTVNTVEPGTLNEQTGYGSLGYTSAGAKISKTVGPILLEVGFGRPESPLAGEISPNLELGSKLPFAEGHVAFLDPDHKGQLYGQSTPLTIGISGAYGLTRVGPGEAALVSSIDPTAVAPEVEDLPSWVASGEAIVPLGPLVLLAEGYLGRGANVYAGAIFQRARVDPETGKHHALGSFGGLGQLSYIPTPGWEVLALAAFDKVHKNLDAGIPINGAPSQSLNRMLAVVATWTVRKELRVALQVHHVLSKYPKTSYQPAGHGSIRSAILDVLLNF